MESGSCRDWVRESERPGGVGVGGVGVGGRLVRMFMVGADVPLASRAVMGGTLMFLANASL